MSEKLFYQGATNCCGCPETIAIRNILKAAGKNTVIVNATSCSEIISSQYPTTSWGVNYIHCAFENAAAVASGVEAALKKMNKKGNVIALAGDGGCYSDDTEIFTENGFKNIKDIKVGEKIWSVNPETNELELAKNEKLHKYRYKGKMIRGKSKFIDFLITPNHNVPIWHKNKWKFIKGYELKTRYKTTFLRKFEWNCKTLEMATIPQISVYRNQKVFNQFPIRPWLRFLGWYISEGTLYKSKSGYLIRIYQSNRKNRKEILELIKHDLGIDAFECNRSVDFQSKQIYEYLEKECGKGFSNKRIPKWVLKLDRSLLIEIYTTLMKGDGSTSIQRGRENPHLRFITSSEFLMNNFVELVLKLGMNCRVSKRKNNNFVIGIDPIYLKHKLYSRRKLYEKQGTKQISEEDYNDYVYCPQLDKNHTLIIKRNGKISLNGNTYDIGFQALSGMVDRGHNVLFICIDNECYANCLSLSALIMTKDGLKKITEIKKGDEIYAFDLKNHGLVLKRCTGIFNNGEKEVFNVNTAHHDIKATANHPFLIVQRNGRGKQNKLIWKTISQLKSGEEIVVLKNLDDGNSYKFNPIKITKVGDYKVTYTNIVEIPTHSSPELMEYLGLFVGDGWIRTDRGEVGFALPEKKLGRQRLLKLYEKIFKANNIRSDKVYVYVNSVNLARFIDSLGFGKGAKNKTIPYWVFTLPKKERQAFVDGLILSDGYKVENSFRYTSASYDLLRRLRLLLQTLDYRVGKIHWRKTEKGKKCAKRFLLKDTESGYICFCNKKGFKNLDKYPSQSRYWDFLAENKFFETEIVKSIKNCGTEPTLDLRVEGEHNFMANGIVVHNTGIQRSSATPYAAWTTTSPSGKKSIGNQTFKKPICEMLAAQGAVYVATSSVAYPKDIQKKVEKALSIKGPKFILIHSPCPIAWKFDSSKTIDVAKLAVETGMWVIYEIENGKLNINMKPAGKRVEEYLKAQGRFRHVTAKEIEKIQKKVDDDWKKYDDIQKADIRIYCKATQ